MLETKGIPALIGLVGTTTYLRYNALLDGY
jgi:hypothetical protein